MKNKNTVLVIGKKSVGKKTLLKNSGLQCEEIINDAIISWENDITRFIIPNKEMTTLTAPTIFKQLKKYHRLQPIQLLLFFIDIQSILDQHELEKTEAFLDAKLQLIKPLQKNITSMIVLTKCDHILGFQEFFGDLHSEERKKPFGITQKSDIETILKNINAKVITRLHQEPSQDKRNLIQLFPTQLEIVMNRIAQLLTRTPFIYFTSSKQATHAVNVLTQIQSKATPVVAEKEFFVAGLFDFIQHLSDNNQKLSKRYEKKRWFVVPLCGILLILLLLSWHTGFQKTAQAIQDIQIELKQSPSLEYNEPLWLAQLNLLRNSIQKLNTSSMRSLKFIGLVQSERINKKLTLLYDARLQTQFLPYIENTLVDTIRQNMAGDPVQLYNALKIYLMLTSDQRYDHDTVVNWFTAYWNHSYPTNTIIRQDMLNHLNQILTLNKDSWPRNKLAIIEAQRTLQELPPDQVAYFKLEGLYSNAEEPLSDSFDDTANFDLSAITIPTLFSSTSFKKIYNEQIPKIVSMLDQGDWVIGIVASKKMSAADQEKTITSVRELYLKHFSQVWQSIIPNIKLKVPTTLSDLQELIDEMNDPNSPFMNFLALVSGNAFLSNKITPTYSIAQIDQYLHKKDSFLKTQPALKNLSDYLKHIQDSDDPDKASYTAATEILNNPNANNPIQAIFSLNFGSDSTLQSWLNSIAQGSWTILLDYSKNYLNRIYSTLVIPDYKKMIENRYPIFDKSTDESTLSDVTHFFEPTGTIDVFFNYYLKPFVNLTGTYWTWATQYGRTIDISQETLESLMRASLIQRMLFSDDNEKASFKFELTPISKSDDIKLIDMTIEGQSLVYSPDQSNALTFVWPGPEPEEVSIRIISPDKDPSVQSFTGPWALFHLMQYATLIPTTNPEQYVMQLTQGNATVSYRLTMEHKVNPFLPGVFDKFRLPENL